MLRPAKIRPRRTRRIDGYAPPKVTGNRETRTGHRLRRMRTLVPIMLAFMAASSAARPPGIDGLSNPGRLRPEAGRREAVHNRHLRSVGALLMGAPTRVIPGGADACHESIWAVRAPSG